MELKNPKDIKDSLPGTSAAKGVIPERRYIAVWIGLVVLTAATVKIAGLNLGKYGALTSIMIASVKAVLIFLFFMHLKYEKVLIKLMLLVTIFIIAVIIGLTFFDIWFRY